MKRLAFVSFACLAAVTFAQDARPPDPQAVAMGLYYRCVQHYSQHLAPTKELTADIATAALAKCQADRENVRAAWRAAPAGKALSLSELNGYVDQIEENARRLAVLTVMESRHPE